MSIHQVPTLFDNYTYVVVDDATGVCAVIDCPEVDPVIALIEKKKWKLSKILCTHHHADHVAGNEELVVYGGGEIPVYGSVYDKNRVPGLTHTLKGGDSVDVGSLRFRVMDIPGHTLGHIAYFIEALPAVFCGDTLFAGGCGRLFEGTPQMMFDSLSALKRLPEETLVYCGHEYTEKNMAFALELEPRNAALIAKSKEVSKKTSQGISTVPTTLAEEISYNPFLRWDSQDLLENLHPKIPSDDLSPLAVFTAVRKWKDSY